MPLDNDIPRSRLTSLIEKERRPVRKAHEILKDHVECKDCDGDGQVLRDGPMPWSAGRFERCETCDGWGAVPKDPYDDELEEVEAVRVPVPLEGEVS